MGILMTGMGRDGAQGLLQIKDAGGITVAQDETTSVVFGMPKAAIDLGASDKVVKLQDIAAEILYPYPLRRVTQVCWIGPRYGGEVMCVYPGLRSGIFEGIKPQCNQTGRPPSDARASPKTPIPQRTHSVCSCGLAPATMRC